MKFLFGKAGNKESTKTIQTLETEKTEKTIKINLNKNWECHSPFTNDQSNLIHDLEEKISNQKSRILELERETMKIFKASSIRDILDCIPEIADIKPFASPDSSPSSKHDLFDIQKILVACFSNQ